MKLYPPILAGTTPPFYESATNGTFSLKVPFSMNKVVSIGEVKGVKLKIRHANNDYLIHSGLDAISVELSTDTSYAIFDLGAQADSMIVGHYYKIQLAYVDQNNVTGYYSTISIIKFTTKPSVYIAGLSTYGVNTDITQYTGIYMNIKDASEKCQQYKFDVFDLENNLIETSGWQIHNSNTDAVQYESTDLYILKHEIDKNSRCKIQYSCLTNNNLLVKSPKYLLINANLLEAELKARPQVALDYDNGCIKLYLAEDPNDHEANSLVGTFVISRSCIDDDYKIWTQIASFALTGSLPEKEVFTDFTVEQGKTYRYSIQQYNTAGVYSKRLKAINATPQNAMLLEVYRKEEVTTDLQALDCLWVMDEDDKLEYGAYDITAYFEDAFLYDGKKQLKIRFNPRVSSFKTVLQETKKNTLGSKYPFFFRNGVVEYKEFPISGLISYLEDESEYFLSRVDDLTMPIDWQDTTDILDDNLYYERLFKMAVLDWLNDGQPKLFRSPGEGNYFVRLTNISLTPNDSLSRMIHTFNCTADEIEAYTPDKLLEYKIIDTESIAKKTLKFGTINFAAAITELARGIGGYYPTAANYQRAVRVFSARNLLNNNECMYLRFEDCIPNTVWFSIIQNEVMSTYVVGATGQYEMKFTEPIQSLQVYFVPPGTANASTNYPTQPAGSVTYGVWATEASKFDILTGATQRDLIVFPQQGGMNNVGSTNYMTKLENIKQQLLSISLLQFDLNTMVQEIDSLQNFINRCNMYLSPITPTRWEVSLIDDNHTINNTIIGTRTIADLLAPGTMLFDRSTGKIYEVNSNSTLGNINALELTLLGNPTVTVQNHSYTLLSTQVCLDDEIIDLADRTHLEVKNLRTMPTQLYWGAYVNPTIVYTILETTYDIEYADESNTNPMAGLVTEARKLKDETDLYHAANILQYELITNNDTGISVAHLVQNSAGDSNGYLYFVWRNGRFERLSDEECVSFTGTEVWRPISFEHWKNGKRTMYDDSMYQYNQENFYQLLSIALNDNG